MEFSLPAWLGGLIGVIVAVAIYLPTIRVIERQLRAQNKWQAPEQRSAFDDRLSVLRRLMLATVIAVLAAAGYWIGKLLGAMGAFGTVGGMRG